MVLSIFIYIYIYIYIYIMNDNIFIKKKMESNTKYNPDIMITYTQAKNIRKKTKYNFSNECYKTIINEKPHSIKNQKDLKINTTKLKKSEIISRLNNSIKSRKFQDTKMKQQYNKKDYNKNLNIFYKNTQQKKILEYQQPIFNEIKQEKNIYFKKMQTTINNNKKRYTNILKSLRNNDIK